MTASSVQPKSTPIVLRITSGLKGLKVWFKTSPELEAALQGERQPLLAFGRGWVTAPTAEVYRLDPSLGGRQATRTNGSGYHLDLPARELIIRDGDYEDAPSVVNISFLRLVGSSADEGIEFTIAGVHSEAAVRSTSKLLIDAVKDFYLMYMKPVSITMTLEER